MTREQLLSLVPNGLNERDYAELAILCLNESGMSITRQEQLRSELGLSDPDVKGFVLPPVRMNADGTVSPLRSVDSRARKAVIDFKQKVCNILRKAWHEDKCTEEVFDEVIRVEVE